ncbi:hypothetical protein COOONC_00934 [Cooperia oncophora]
MMAALDVPVERVYEEVKRVAMRLEKLQKGDLIDKVATFKGLLLLIGPVSKREPWLSTYTNATIVEKGDIWQRTAEKERNPRTTSIVRAATTAIITIRETTHGSSLARELGRWCKTVQRKGEDPKLQTGAIGKPSACEVEIFDITAKALVDTGSVFSITLLKRVREQGVDLDDKAHIVGMGKNAEITTEVMVIGASTVCVHMHMQQSNDDTLLLGTNALEVLGISLELTANVRATRNGFANDPCSGAAYSDKRVVVGPGKVATVKIFGRNSTRKLAVFGPKTLV